MPISVFGYARLHSTFDRKSSEIVCPFNASASHQNPGVLQPHSCELLEFTPRFCHTASVWKLRRSLTQNSALA